MGSKENINYDQYPKQTNKVGKKVEVCYHYNTSKTHHGFILRDDAEDPYETIFQLENGRVLRSVECHYRFLE